MKITPICMESETKNWQIIKKQCPKEDSLPVRIGGITPAKPPELRLSGVICRDSRGVLVVIDFYNDLEAEVEFISLFQLQREKRISGY